MAGPYYIYSGAGGSGTGADWTNAFTSFKAMFDYGGAGTGPGTSGNLLAATDTIYVASDHDDSGATYGAAVTIYGPNSGAPVRIISVDRTSGTPPTTYQTGSSVQFDTSGDGALTFDGSFYLCGLRLRSAADINLTNDSDELMVLQSCYLLIGAGEQLNTNGAQFSTSKLLNCTVDGTAGGTTQNVIYPSSQYTTTYIDGMTFANVSTRTGHVIGPNLGNMFISNTDFTPFTNATLCEPFNGSTLVTYVNNCKLTSAQAAQPIVSGAFSNGPMMLVNCSNADDPSAMLWQIGGGQVTSTQAVYRANGANVEDVTTLSWKCITSSGAREESPFVTPWVYGRLATSGTKTFSVYITNNTQDRTDAEVWLEVETMETEDSPVMTRRSDYRGGSGSSNADILDSATAQTDDTAGAWTGGGAYDQALVVSNVSVGETGLYRWRVAIAVASLTTDNQAIYIDPKPWVS